MILIDFSRKFDLYLADERDIDATGITTQRTQIFVGHMAVLARHLSEELFLDRRVKQVGVVGMVFTVRDEAVGSERRTRADDMALVIGGIDI